MNVETGKSVQFNFWEYIHRILFVLDYFWHDAIVQRLFKEKNHKHLSRYMNNWIYHSLLYTLQMLSSFLTPLGTEHCPFIVYNNTIVLMWSLNSNYKLFDKIIMITTTYVKI